MLRFYQGSFSSCFRNIRSVIVSGPGIFPLQLTRRRFVSNCLVLSSPPFAISERICDNSTDWRFYSGGCGVVGGSLAGAREPGAPER